MGHYVLIYTGSNILHPSLMEPIFQDLFDVFVTNINILFYKNGEGLLYTYFPFSASHCKFVQPVLYNRFQPGSNGGKLVYRKPFFPKKFKNFFGCEIVVQTQNDIPYIEVLKDSTGKVVGITGIEGNLITLLAKKMNFKMKIVLSRDRGKVFKNLTVIGGYKKVSIENFFENTKNLFFLRLLMGKLTLQLTLIFLSSSELKLCRRLVLISQYLLS